MRRRPTFAPVPPRDLGPARTVRVADRGEFFVRDLTPARATDAPVVLLLHGWAVSADLNWHGAYDALLGAGHRVLALDHRGHGRGLRAPTAFRLTDCADDAAAVLRALDTGPAIVVGYSMGGTIAQLMARDHADVVAGAVYTGTCQHFQDPATVGTWKWMGVMGLAIGLAPRTFYRAGLRRSGLRAGMQAAWTIGELMRHEARDVAEAGRELGRFDSRPWLRGVTVPSAIVLTARDSAVSPTKQRELADACGASAAGRVYEVPIDHLQPASRAEVYNPALIEAIASLRDIGPAAVGGRSTAVA
jgi:3-oxoadipate enol-lactonase